MVIHLVGSDGLGESIERCQVQVDGRDEIEQLLRLEIVLARVLDLQVDAPVAAQLHEVKVEHSSKSVDQFLELRANRN